MKQLRNKQKQSEMDDYYDVTSNFWPMITYCVMMAQERLLTLKTYNDYKMLAASKKGYKMHISALHDLRPYKLTIAFPEGMYITDDRQYLLFDNINRLLYGIQKLYASEYPSKRQSDINVVVYLIEKAIAAQQMNDISDMFSKDLSIN